VKGDAECGSDVMKILKVVCKLLEILSNDVPSDILLYELQVLTFKVQFQISKCFPQHLLFVIPPDQRS